MTNTEIKKTLDGLKLGDKLIINDWKAKYTVCGISPHFVLAHYGMSYTIISKRQWQTYPHNGVREGDYYCGPDWWIFGYATGYDFTSRDWVCGYLADLEDGEMEISMKKNVPLLFLSVVGHTEKVYRNAGANVKRK